MCIRVLGKGRRERTLPLWKTTAAALRAWLAVRGRVAAPEVFVNIRGEPLSRWGFAYLLKQHAATALESILVSTRNASRPTCSGTHAR